MKKLLIIALAITLCFAFAGCGGGGGVLNPDADKEGVTDDSWSEGIWAGAVNDMIEKGYVQKNPEEGVIFVFQNNGEIELSEEGKAKLTAEFKPDGKVIWGSIYATQSEDEAPHLDHCAGEREGFDEESDTPYYTSENLVAPTKADAFAGSRGRCKYLMLMAALCYNLKEDYYVGNVDRLDISTYVFVIDAVSKEVVHIHYINSNSPGAIAHSYMGDIYEEAAYEYMNKICQE